MSTPYLLNTAAAGGYLGQKGERLRRIRFDDMKRLERGEPIQGPEWVVVDGRVFYRPEALERWVERKAVPLGRAGEGAPPRSQAPSASSSTNHTTEPRKDEGGAREQV